MNWFEFTRANRITNSIARFIVNLYIVHFTDFIKIVLKINYVYVKGMGVEIFVWMIIKKCFFY